MQVLLALIFGAAVGAAWHFALAHRALRGVALGPIIGALLGGATWVALTWLGQTTESVWLWLAAIVVPTAVTPVLLAVISRVRLSSDARERVRLGI